MRLNKLTNIIREHRCLINERCVTHAVLKGLHTSLISEWMLLFMEGNVSIENRSVLLLVLVFFMMHIYIFFFIRNVIVKYAFFHFLFFFGLCRKTIFFIKFRFCLFPLIKWLIFSSEIFSYFFLSFYTI